MLIAAPQTQLRLWNCKAAAWIKAGTWARLALTVPLDILNHAEERWLPGQSLYFL